MASDSNWRSQLSAMQRYENIQKLKKCIEAKGLSSTGNAQKLAFSEETEAYNSSKSREEYDAACNAITTGSPRPFEDPEAAIPPTTGITIGKFQDCHHIASGLVSEVYRAGSQALKVIVEMHNVEPHNPFREVKILSQLDHATIIHLNESFRDAEGRLVLAFPYMPLTLAKIIGAGNVPEDLNKRCFHDLFSGLAYLHSKDIIHRDIKPSNLLLASPTGPAYISDFGTAWHPTASVTDEPAHHKVLEVGTTCYRAPETLFGKRAYDSSIDIWAAGAMLVECLRKSPKVLFESRESSEDGNQLGLILSMFKTLGTPTRETWPEAVHFTTPPFDWYQSFPGRGWDELLEGVNDEAADLVKKMMRYESRDRLTAQQALEHPYLSLYSVPTQDQVAT